MMMFLYTYTPPPQKFNMEPEKWWFPVSIRNPLFLRGEKFSGSSRLTSGVYSRVLLQTSTVSELPEPRLNTTEVNADVLTQRLKDLSKMP